MPCRTTLHCKRFRQERKRGSRLAVAGLAARILDRYLGRLSILILLLVRPGPVPSVGSRLKVLISVSEVDSKSSITFASIFFSFLNLDGMRI